jgi:midasin
VVELLSILQQNKLRIINCHATTETSDLIGGLRPVRGRNFIAGKMLEVLQQLLLHWPDRDILKTFDLPDFVYFNPDDDLSRLRANRLNDQDKLDQDLPEGAVSVMIELARKLQKAYAQEDKVTMESPKKRLKLAAGDGPNRKTAPDGSGLGHLFEELEALFRRHSSLFEWADGPVAAAMKSGDMLLLDELSLAEDAVLERLNSVLEPSRTLVLAEKGEDDIDTERDTRVIHAHDNFAVFATMNPGGDFGKRELSPALRSRFTEIWVPAVDDMSDIELVLARSLVDADPDVHSCQILQKILEYIEWFNSVCKDPASPFAGLSLSLRDVLAWTTFIIKARESNKELGLWDAYCHGAALMHLDGVGLGTGLGIAETSTLNQRAQEFLLKQTHSPQKTTAFSCEGSRLRFSTANGLFGVHPFWVPTGSLSQAKSSFNFHAPTTAENAYRVLRAMQLPKPILLEGKS